MAAVAAAASPSVQPGSSTVLDNLNDAQCRAVCSEASTVAIMAGPGSGKTHTLTSRVVWLVDALGYQPQNVVVATFTVKAAREMRERIGRALGHARGSKLVLGTFHSIARRYLAAYGRHIGLDQKFSIADDADSKAIITRVCKRLQLSIDPVQARAWISKRKAKGKEWKPTPLRRKRSGEAAEGSRAFETCYQAYQDHLERSNLLDYDDLLVRCVELLEKRPACVSNIEAVLIDEYQDTNGVQYDLMRLLAQTRNRITIVGDPDQSIYGWRSAEIANLRRLFDDFPKTDQISLEENYRSSQAILDTSLSVIQQDAKRYQKVLRPVHDKGTRPTLRRLKSSADEASWIVSEIRRTQMMSGRMIGPEDIAILLRSASLSRHLETSLGKAGIAYRMVGGFKFYERAEIKVLLDYLRVIHQPENNDALARIINVPKRGLGDATIKALLEEAERSSLSLWNLLTRHCRGDRAAKTSIKKTVEQRISGELIRLVLDIQKKARQPTDQCPYTLVDIIDDVLARLSFEKYLQDSYRDEYEQRWANVQEFRALGSDFIGDGNIDVEDDLPEIDGLHQTKDDDVLARFLANVSLASDAQNKGQDQASTPMVTISTIHAAKGLEWPVVFIPAAYNGSIPHMRSDDTDEERRLFCPLVSTSYGGQAEVELSTFLEPVAKLFGRIGPELECHRLEMIGRILGRQVPTQQLIYDGLPGGFSPSDDLYPEDPASQQYEMGINPLWDDLSSEAPRRKRPRLTGPTHESQGNEELVWVRNYSTTMEQQQPTFTMASQLGFVTSGSHQATLGSLDPAGGAAVNRGPRKSKAAPTGGQTTLLSFVKGRSVKGPQENPGLSHSGLQRMELESRVSRPKNAEEGRLNRPAIEPQLSSHRVRPGPISKPKPTAARLGAPGSKGRYVHFSSSPPRPTTPNNEAEAGDMTPQECREGPGSVGSQSTASRPAASLHNTTMNMQKTHVGVKRPPGLGLDVPTERIEFPPCVGGCLRSGLGGTCKHNGSLRVKILDSPDKRQELSGMHGQFETSLSSKDFKMATVQLVKSPMLRHILNKPNMLATLRATGVNTPIMTVRRSRSAFSTSKNTGPNNKFNVNDTEIPKFSLSGLGLSRRTRLWLAAGLVMLGCIESAAWINFWPKITGRDRQQPSEKS
ncbi:ATP dependent DNA helicase activity protein [Cryphonectria parasitica EP155]|uniref:DNA 3'-5' helicase n=1 Tax=Cryphonectria parasitica (strain ATCC 38755 / EP155) TaxID=660469 RepID=A0A9P5CKH0_CRYP1|nr:ATP dependent DNA helicase activity protein [Cryphonectria parasitica EP155]KAF3762063.1 ATP dependent DNA helicase activity protein [Cryphonectria parasitica EP155]